MVIKVCNTCKMKKVVNAYSYCLPCWYILPPKRKTELLQMRDESKNGHVPKTTLEKWSDERF